MSNIIPYDTFPIIEQQNIYSILLRPPGSIFIYMNVFYQYGNIGDMEASYKICLN